MKRHSLNLHLRSYSNLLFWSVCCYGVICVDILLLLCSGEDEGDIEGGQRNKWDKQEEQLLNNNKQRPQHG